MIPEYVFSTHVHQVLMPSHGKLVHIVPPETALVLHLRLIGCLNNNSNNNNISDEKFC